MLRLLIATTGVADLWFAAGGRRAARTIGDFIAGMTDRFAIARHEELVGPVDLPDRF